MAGLVALCCGLFPHSAIADSAANDEEHLEIPFLEVEPELRDFLEMKPPPHLDGKMAKVSGFIQRIPDDGAPSTFLTEVYTGWDREHLYAVFVAFDDEPEKIRGNMAPRESVFNDDTVNIMIDTFNDQRRAYFFLSNPLGIQADGLYIEGTGFDGSFDAVWDSDGRVTDRGYVVRIKVPFKSIRFPDTERQVWRVIFNRDMPRLSEDTFWPHYSLAIEGRLNQTAVLTGIHDVSPGRNMLFAPFAFYRDFRLETEDTGGTSVDDDNEEAVGLDAKMVLRDAYVLDVTANPDYSQVESDEPQVTVNERFEVFFPERRPFFLENADLFRTPTNLFFTRRIEDPEAGVRLTGKAGNYTIAALVANDEAPGKEADPGTPLDGEAAAIGVVRVSRDVSAQSKIGLMLTDRELDTSHNRVAALDARIKLDENWVGELQFAAADTRTPDTASTAGGVVPGESLDGVSYNAMLNRSGTHVTSHTHYLYTSPGFRTDLGFLGEQQRPDSQDLHQQIAYRFRPAESKLTDWGPSLLVERVLDASGNGLDWRVLPKIDWSFRGRTIVGVTYEHFEERLLPEDFAGLSAPADFSQNLWGINFETERFLRWGMELDLSRGTSVNFVPPDGAPPELADARRIQAGMLWRPIVPLRFDFTYIRTRLDDRAGSGRIFTDTLGRVKANWQFTKALSARVIADFEDVDPVTGRTSLTDEQTLVFDALVRWVWNPWQALYLGYTSSARDHQALDPADVPVDLEDRGEQFFVKFSYLFQL